MYIHRYLLTDGRNLTLRTPFTPFHTAQKHNRAYWLIVIVWVQVCTSSSCARAIKHSLSHCAQCLCYVCMLPSYEMCCCRGRRYVPDTLSYCPTEANAVPSEAKHARTLAQQRNTGFLSQVYSKSEYYRGSKYITACRRLGLARLYHDLISCFVLY